MVGNDKFAPGERGECTDVMIESGGGVRFGLGSGCRGIAVVPKSDTLLKELELEIDSSIAGGASAGTGTRGNNILVVLGTDTWLALL
jgi:hypothetical protein